MEASDIEYTRREERFRPDFNAQQQAEAPVEAINEAEEQDERLEER